MLRNKTYFLINIVGLSIAAGATLALSTLSRSAHELDVVWRLALFGVGMAVFQSANNSAIMGSVERRFLGLASGMMATMRTLGFGVGVALGAGLLAAAYAAATGGVPLPPGNTVPDPDAFVAGQSTALLVIAALCAAGVVTSLVRGAKRAPQPQAPKGAAAQGGSP